MIRNSVEPYYKDEYVTLYCGDSAVVLSLLESFDLLLTDPPYGIGEKADASRYRPCGKWKRAQRPDHGIVAWDVRVPEWLLDEAIAKCGKSIVFGGQHYDLGPTTCFLIWDKENSGDFADCEIAWTNLKQANRIYRHLWNGFCRKNGEERFHPTQKPFDVMSWCIGQAGEVQSVLDPFCGSGTTLVAAKLRNLQATGIEREERYCEIAANRLSQRVLNFENVAR